MIRAQSRFFGAAVSPLAAVAVGADGETYISPVIVSTQCWTIRDVFQTPAGSTISIRLNLQPNDVPTSLVVRIDGGMNGVTRGKHPADGSWTVTPGANPYTYELVGSTWVAGSVFGGGHAYVPGSLLESSVEFDRVNDFARAHAPATIYLPWGGMYIRDMKVSWPESCRVEGHGGKNTFFFQADYADMGASPIANVMGTGPSSEYGNVAELYLSGFTLYGNRPYNRYQRGSHAFSPGTDTDTGVPITLVCEDVHVIGSGGYGTSLGGYNAKVDCVFDRCSWIFSDSDNFDIKNRTNLNDRVLFRNCRFGWHAMGSQGTNVTSVNTTGSSDTYASSLGSNPITTVAGQTYITIPVSKDSNARAGEVATLAGLDIVDGVNPNGSWNCISVSGGITLETGQTPSVGGVTGGGSTGTMFMPHISIGDCIIDFRGIRHSVTEATWDGELSNRNGFRQRGGQTGAINGIGGTNCSFHGIRGVDHTPDWVAGTDGEGRGFVTLLGVGAIVRDIALQSSSSICIAIGAAASGYKVSDCMINGGTIGIQCRGEKGKIYDNDINDCSQKGIEVWGYTSGAQIPLDENPFTAVVSSSTVTVAHPAHGFSNGQNVRFAGVSNSNGITIRSVNTDPAYAISGVTTNTYDISATGSALTTDAWGGASIQVYVEAGDHDATENEIRGNTFRQSDVGNTAVAIAIGVTNDGASGRASETAINFNRNFGYSRSHEDNGNGTKWGIGNEGGFPNQITVDTIAVPKADTTCWQLHDTEHTLPVGEGSYIIGNLGACREIMVEMVGVTHTSGSSQNFPLFLSIDGGETFKDDAADYQRIGASAGTESILWCGQVAGATPASGIVTIESFNVPSRSFFEVSGGENGAATGAQSAAGFMEAEEAYNAIKLTAVSGFGAGKVRVFRRD